ncbi:MAG: UDP-N-acetylmuramoyl-L-alanyl-D-glutamate--2,6-diaminopimelate ligase, partial [Phycisphaerales bacterium JB041]
SCSKPAPARPVRIARKLAQTPRTRPRARRDKVPAGRRFGRYAQRTTMHLAQLLQHAELTPQGPINSSAEVLGITEDSRRVRAGWVFIARPGLRADGRRFIRDAIAAGAVAVITDQSHAPAAADSVPSDVPLLRTPDPALVGAVMAEALAGSPSSRLKLIGVTGTNGKSTITSLVSQLANLAHLRCGLIGTVEIDDGSGTVPSDFTTPPAERLSALIGRMVDNNCHAAAIEVSSHALDQRRVAGLRFGAAVFTNLTGDHLDYHKDMASYAAAKARLFAALAPDALAIVNADDPASARMLTDCPATVYRCTLGKTPQQLDSRAARHNPSVEVLHTDSRGMRVRLSGGWGTIETQTTLLGLHNAMNLLQAVVVAAHALDLGPETIAHAVPRLHPPAGRLERVNTDRDDLTVFIDFAHTDDALASALRAARLATPAHTALWAVFGCGGNKDRAKRPRMGLAAATLADRAVVTSDNPRAESPDAIIDEVIAGVPADRRPAVRRDADRRAAILATIADAAPGDVIVIAGKGHEREQILPDGAGGTRTIPFHDHEIAREALRARRGASDPAGDPRPVNGGVA